MLLNKEADRTLSHSTSQMLIHILKSIISRVQARTAQILNLVVFFLWKTIDPQAIYNA